jgi:hypothetical protein
MFPVFSSGKDMIDKFKYCHLQHHSTIFIPTAGQGFPPFDLGLMGLLWFEFSHINNAKPFAVSHECANIGFRAVSAKFPEMVYKVSCSWSKMVSFSEHLCS